MEMENAESEIVSEDKQEEHIVPTVDPETLPEPEIDANDDSRAKIDGNCVTFSISDDHLVPETPILTVDKALSLLDLVEKGTDAVQRVSSDSNLSSSEATTIQQKNFASFDSSTDSYQRTSSSQSCPINEYESKFLEEQANLKRQLDEAQNKCSELLETVSKRDETIALLAQNKILLEKEKSAIKRELEIATKEKENAVIRYATVEKNVLDAKLAKEKAEKRVADAQKEVEAANTRMKFAVSEKNRVTGLYDAKCQEFRLSQREIDRLKGDVSQLETKLKWSTSKVKTETDAKLAAEKRVEELTEEVNKLKLEEITRAKEEVENEKALVTEKQFMEQQATLILLKHGNEEKERRIEILTKKLSSATTENAELNAKVRQLTTEIETLTAENARQKQEIDELQLQLDKEVIKGAELQAKTNDIESLQTQLSLSKDEASRIKRELDAVTLNYDELCQEVEKIRGKETELLQFNKELTERCVKLQNDGALLNSKLLAIELENSTIKKDKKYYDDIIEKLQTESAAEKKERAEERILMTKHISERTKQADALQKELDLVTGDMQALKKKHSQTVKELTRETTQLRKKIEVLEAKLASSNHSNNSLNSESETEKDSNSKSDTISINSDSDGQPQAQTHSESSSLNFGEPSKKSLIERILKLQHATARQAEKIDFLENHSATLVAELQKKSKLIQDYMLREQSGALASAKSDKNKAELSKYGGIMAAVYGGAAVKSTSSEMTLDLSLEINRKLQALLEDTILKNITLKENVDTLGLEVDALMKKIANSKK
ncbi:coiled-coil domain-containing protein 186 [Culicoides brevitarsis]|uniref:coiled-coil domain-containing protein 186 n=1 Tax=Culicoides brevitarsis TaxID=469753 RepID=UPI00307CADBA